MKKTKLLVGAITLLFAAPIPTHAQEAVTIIGNLINSYSYGYDPSGSESGAGWHQTSVGNGATIGEDGTATSTGAANIGLMSIKTSPVTTEKVDRWSKVDATSYKEETQVINDFDWHIRDHVLYSNAGGVYVGGNTFYSFFMTEANSGEVSDSEYGSESYIVKVRKYTWDGVDANGMYTNVKRKDVCTMTTQALDLAYDPLNDIIYGVFYDGSTYKIGTLDINETAKKATVSYISKEGFLWGAPQCIAVNSKGELYAIDASGSIYRVDKTDGTLTTIGNVGFKSQQMRMSATIDLRTDKLYWIGFINDGMNSYDTSGTNTTLQPSLGGRDTGLYEIDTNTGEATLIGELYQQISANYDIETGKIVYHGYRGLQMTGIYVDGSFTRKEIDQRIIMRSYPAQLTAGEQGTVKVNVKNIGNTKVLAKNYVVNLYVNDQLVATIDRDSEPDPVNNLEVNDSQELTFTFTAPATGTVARIYAEVVNEGDEESRNNKTEIAEVILLSGKTLPCVVLSGVEETSGGLTISWEDPKGHILDGAEDYAAFTYDGLNNWTMVDGDKGYTQKANNSFSTIDYPNWNTPKAFIVMDPVKAGFGRQSESDGKRFAPHSGNQYFAGFWTATPELGEIDNDDYMVSPELSGEAQTISFWAKGYIGTVATDYETNMRFNETMEVLYTTDADNLDPTTYTVAKETFKVNEEAWEQYKVDLPAGAKHFALHRNSLKREITSTELGDVEVPGTGSFVMMIDDIEFQGIAQTVTGYKIYRNGVLVKTVDADVLSYKDNRARATDTYTVTALYADGESIPSNPVSINILNSIQEIVASGLNSGVTQIYDLNGQCIQHISRPGIYIIRQGHTTRKVVVK